MWANECGANHTQTSTCGGLLVLSQLAHWPGAANQALIRPRELSGRGCRDGALKHSAWMPQAITRLPGSHKQDGGSHASRQTERKHASSLGVYPEAGSTLCRGATLSSISNGFQRRDRLALLCLRFPAHGLALQAGLTAPQLDAHLTIDKHPIPLPPIHRKRTR